MAEIKEYIWIIPLIGGIFAIITLLVPAATMNFMGAATADLWVWGLYNYNIAGNIGTQFMVLIPSLITTVIITSSGILLIASSIGLRKTPKNVRNFSLIAGMLVLVAEALWLIVVPMVFPIEDFFPPLLPGMTLTFWSWSYSGMGITLHTVGFGIIGGFISAVIAFIGAGVAQYYSKDHEVIIPKKKETVPTIKEPVASETPKQKFCPECGAEIEDGNIKFCGKCGSDLKPPEIAPL